ncbi:MAG: prophage antirepressor-like protein [Sulfurimonas sp.]|jgi:prophage antirepressor-like protein|uniref:RhuM family protein n=1 Tax=Sulfurimonas sp. TaxID=2022749 RepID=UPI0039E43B8D
MDKQRTSTLKEQAVIYNDGELELKISVNSESVWLTQKQLCDIFAKDQSVISRHINNIFKDNEVDEKSNMQKMHIAPSDKPVSFYSLDIVLAVGYRTNSSKAIKFRQWATSVLKHYIQNAYVVNTDKISLESFISLENDVSVLKNEMGDIKSLIQNNKLEVTQGIFYDGQVYDAYIFVSDLIKKASKSIVLIDNYIDDSVLTLLSKRDADTSCVIYTKSITKQIKLDLEKHNLQYPKIEVKKFGNSHDRFLILDEEDVYHIGASLKDLGKKWFAFSKFDIQAFDILSKLAKGK